MLSLSEFKKLAGKEAQGFTDKELEQIRDAQYQFAELAFDMWAKEKGLEQNIDTN